MKKTLTVLIFSVICCVVANAQAIYVVNSADDTDDMACNALHCSLREAINAANTNDGPDSIEFNIPGVGPHIITLNSELPAIQDEQFFIDGTTQPGNFPMAGQVIIDGSALSPGPFHGLVVYVDSVEIYGLQIQGFPADGIQLFGGFVGPQYLSNIKIGAPTKGNVIIQNASHGIEGPVDRNVIIQGNYVGTDLQFNPGLGNAWDGIFLVMQSGQNVRVGGLRNQNQQNYLCSNVYSGLRVLVGEPADFLAGFRITGNVIGTDVSGGVNLGNLGQTFGGAQVGGGIVALGTGPMIIGGAADRSNIIAFNYRGVYTETDNRKTIQENSFYCNTDKGIHLDNNANDGILPPTILCTQGNSLIGTTDPNVTVDVYLHGSPLCPDVACQGRMLIGQATADGTGSWSFDVSAWPAGQFTAIAQDAMGNSSAFSACVLDPHVTAMNSGPYCFGDSIFLSAELDTMVSNVVFEWFGPGGFTSNQQNPNNATQAGTYTVVATIMGCGADTATTDVVVFSNITVDTIIQLCIDDSVVVNGTVYNATNSSGLEILQGASQYGCDSTVILALQFTEHVSGNIISTRPRACLGDTVSYWFNLTYGGGGGGPFDVVYTTGLGPPDTAFNAFDGDMREIVVTSDVHFDILEIITDLTLCEPVINVSDSIMVSSLDIDPMISNYAGYGVSCFGENDGMIILNTTGSVGTVNYQWNLSSLQGDMASQLSAGSYSVTVSDGAGCRQLFDTLITQPPRFESITRTEPTTCVGINDGVLFIDAVLGARGPVTYSIDGGPFLPAGTLPIEINGLPPGLVDVVLMDSIGCVNDQSIFVPLGETPSVTLGTEKSILFGDSVLLNFNSSLFPEQITWTPSQILSCPTCPETYAYPDTSQFVTVTLMDSSGCSAVDSVLILVFIPRKVFIPNVFSPNHDQVNDVFYIQGDPDLITGIEYMIIADRWGNVVFERSDATLPFPVNDPAYGWDGTLNGKEMFSAVFTYLVRIRFKGNEIVPYSGTVTLIR